MSVESRPIFFSEERFLGKSGGARKNKASRTSSQKSSSRTSSRSSRRPPSEPPARQQHHSRSPSKLKRRRSENSIHSNQEVSQDANPPVKQQRRRRSSSPVWDIELNDGKLPSGSEDNYSRSGAPEQEGTVLLDTRPFVSQWAGHETAEAANEVNLASTSRDYLRGTRYQSPSIHPSQSASQLPSRRPSSRSLSGALQVSKYFALPTVEPCETVPGRPDSNPTTHVTTHDSQLQNVQYPLGMSEAVRNEYDRRSNRSNLQTPPASLVDVPLLREIQEMKEVPPPMAYYGYAVIEPMLSADDSSSLLRPPGPGSPASSSFAPASPGFLSAARNTEPEHAYVLGHSEEFTDENGFCDIAGPVLDLVGLAQPAPSQMMRHDAYYETGAPVYHTDYGIPLPLGSLADDDTTDIHLRTPAPHSDHIFPPEDDDLDLSGAMTLEMRQPLVEQVTWCQSDVALQRDVDALEVSWAMDDVNPDAETDLEYCLGSNFESDLDQGGSVILQTDLVEHAEVEDEHSASSDPGLDSLPRFSEGRALLLGVGKVECSGVHGVHSGVSKVEQDVARRLKGHWLPQRF